MSEAGYTPDRAINVQRFSEIDARVAASRCICGGKLLVRGEGSVHTPGGAATFGWRYRTDTDRPLNRIALTTGKMKRYEKMAAETGTALKTSDIPRAARRDWPRISWIVAGLAAMLLMLFLRRYIFWMPHPIGYVMWMCNWPMRMVWFSLFAGWILKWVIVKYGGIRTYTRAKRVFMGFIFGEASAAILWLAVAAYQGQRFGYAMHID